MIRNRSLYQQLQEMELYKNALTTKKQWRIVRGLIAMVALTFFALK